MIYLGFDPGLSGGVAAIDSTTKQVTAAPMPVTGGEVDARRVGEWVYRLALKAGEGQIIAVVEKVHSMPKQGIASTFKFGKGYGVLLGVLGAYCIRTELVPPEAWKRVVLAGAASGKEAAIEWCCRNTGIALIQPGCRKPHDGIADAICIAEYGIRTFK